MNKFVILFLLTAMGMKAQQADLRFEVAGVKEKKAVLAYYLGGQSYKIDSTLVDTLKGAFHFQTAKLKPGVHLIILGNMRLLDFIVSKPDERLLVRGNVADLSALEVSGSPENEIFFQFEKNRILIDERIESKKEFIGLVRKASKNDLEALKPLEAGLMREYKSIDSLVEDYQEKYPQHCYARMLKSVRPPEPPADLQPVLNGKTNPAYLRWAAGHYFDFTDFSDERLLRNKIWNIYFDNYFQRLVNPNPDSLAKAMDDVLAKMPKNEAFYKWAVVHLTQIFEQNEEPGADRLFVHLVDKYQKVKETPWMDEATLLRLEYKANVFRPILTGNIAPDFSLHNKKGEVVSLHNQQSPLMLLIFYSPLCKHCMEFMPDIYQNWLDAQSFGVGAIAVNTDNQYAYWQQFVAQQNYAWIDLADPGGNNAFEKVYNNYNLPVIMLLDKDKRILRKRIKPEKLRETLRYYLNQRQ